MRFLLSLTLTGASLALFAAPAAARDKVEATDPSSPAVYEAVVRCRGIADPVQRLACFDRSVEAMDSAAVNKDLVILDRATMRETRKGLFGFSLPKLRLFGSGNGDGDERDEVKEIESTITGIRMANDGLPIFTIVDGAKWKQTDGRNVFPKIGSQIKIKRAALGSYFAEIGGMKGARVIRLTQ